ncbi:protein OXIDATIVE STRESS 3 LIKE 2-like [Magnolia sinica]|uniref:protein OXIDATIVE STRESS 3 LIKE 2-like n=1 Tax=Magnolia sinica TaxID=86752 RepID=UPI00265A6F5A|nr:protein OXIDATIVE STRESS 3 LIKE 2-like [Magnolia sinica]
MSIALESSSARIERSGFIRGISPCISIFDPPEPGRNMPQGDRRFAAADPTPKVADEEEETSCSSSIGRNSDCLGGPSSGSDGEDSGEVQSSYKGPLDMMDALEESLPIRRGISKFYCGKSKSFTSLADTSSSAKDLAKPDNAYNRKRKNLLAFTHYLDRNRNSPLRSTAGSISKRPANSSRSTLALGVAMSSSESSMSEEHEPRLPPLHPQGKSPICRSPSQWSFSSRSFSLSDLQGASSNSPICLRDKHKKFC